MIKKISFFVVSIFFPLLIFAKEAVLDFEKKWNENENDYYNNMILTNDGGYLITGQILDDEDTIQFIKKYNTKGELDWKKTFGSYMTDQEFEDVITIDDGSFIVAGYSDAKFDGLEYYGSNDAIIVKYDKDGNLKWITNSGTEYMDSFDKVLIMNDGNIIAFGEAFDNNELTFITKFDQNGNKIWEKNLWNQYLVGENNIYITENDEIIAIGTMQDNNSDVIIIKLDKDGNQLWERKYGGTTTREWFYSADITKDNQILIIGETDYKAFILKYDINGNLLYEKEWGGNDSDSLYYIKEVSDGGYIVLGGYVSTDIEGLPNKGKRDMVLMKYNNQGEELWKVSWGGNGYEYFGNGFYLDSLENIIIPGWFQSTDIIEGYRNVILKYNKDGEKICELYVDAHLSKALLNDKEELFVISDDYDNKKIFKYIFNYTLENISESINGSVNLVQEKNTGLITSTPDLGYEIKEIVIKDTLGNHIEITKTNDGKYLFPLYDDVTVEVLFSEVIDNPKTGILDVMTILIIGFIMSVTGIFIVKNYNERLEF